MKSGKFNKKDVERINQSVRKDRYWTYIKKYIKTQYSNLNNKIVICELGCGTGDIAILSNKYTKNYVSKYYAIDASKEMLNFLKIENIGFVDIINKDIDENIKLPKSDIFLSKFTFHHLNNKDSLIREISDKLSKNGVFIIIDNYLRFGKISLLIEKLFNIINIKKILGKHNYSKEDNIINVAKMNHLEIIEKIEKNGKKLKNFHIKKIIMIFRKL
jgi:SAM-dependent methyltransferase